MKFDFEKLKKISEKPWFYPMALFLIAFVSYGYVLTSLGYYWSDWEVVMFAKLHPSLRFGFYMDDRPFPWTYQLIYSLVGLRPIGWHIVTMLLRWGGTLFFVHAMIQFWPIYRKQFYWLGALLVVYPGFVQQSQSAAFSRHIMTLFLFTLSLYLMALAIKRPEWVRLFFPLSWIATFMHLFTIEYFSGIEFMRPVLIWVLVAYGNKKDMQLLRKVVLYSLPYMLITAFFLWARFIYYPTVFQTGLGHFEGISSTFDSQRSIFNYLTNFFNNVVLDLLYSTLQVWTNSITGFVDFTFQRTIVWFAFGLGALFALAFAFFYNTKEDDPPSTSSVIPMILVGLLLFVTSALPIWAMGKDLGAGGWNVRFSLAPMFGASLMTVGLILLFVRPAGQKWLLGFLLMFSVATQIWIVNLYRRDWMVQPDYYWQLYWRAPALQPDTAVLSFGYPSPFITHDLDATWAVNILYDFQIENGLMPYMFLTPEKELYFQPNTAIKRRVRNLAFNGNTSDVVAVLHQTETSCLRVLDTVYMYDPVLGGAYEKLLPLSNLSRIIPDPVSAAPPDTDIFGPEPAHTWCYFFQKADLARQTQDWNQVINLYKQAQQMGFSSKNGAEYLPLVEAYAQTGDWQKAYDLTITARRQSLDTLKMWCSNWARFQNIPSADMKFIEQIYQTFSC